MEAGAGQGASEQSRAGGAGPLDGEGWAQDPRSRCRVWVGEARPDETIVYTGKCPNGVASGEGELQRRAGEQVLAMYLGTFTNGRLNGPGVRITANGDRIEAPFVEGRAHGQGVLRYRGIPIDRYEGMFRDDQPNGRGTRFWPNGARYEGEWANGGRSGQGFQLFPDGSKYTGTWRGDQPNGRGTMQYANGDTYEGDWANGRRSGRGTLRWFWPGWSGVYDGQWLNDRRSGFARESFLPDGSVYEGNYASDRPQGRGVYITRNGDRFEGDVQDGCMRTGWRVLQIGPAATACQ